MFALCIESSHTRGLGHLFRALNLAAALEARGHAVIFLVNDHTPSIGVLQAHGYTAAVVDLQDVSGGWEGVLTEQHGVSLWINDRLDTSAAHARRVKALGLPLVTFDDRGDGAALADLHVAALAFGDEVLAGHRVLTGVDYLVLNPDIAHHQRLRSHAGSLLVTLGGSDTHGATVKVVAQLAARGIRATVVVGPGFGHRQALDDVLTGGFELLVGVPSMIEEMSRHDLAITGGGITPFEANAAGLPCVVVANESFEIPVAQELQRLGGAVYAGHHSAFELPALDSLAVERMSRAGMSNVGLGGTARVVQAVEELRA